MSGQATETHLYGGKVTVKFQPSNHAYYVGGKRKSGVTTFVGIVDKSRALVIWATDLACEHLVGMIGRGEKVSVEAVVEACSLHEQRKQEAADIGHDIHAWCESYVRHKLRQKGAAEPEMPERPEVQMGAASFVEWTKAHKVKFVSTERVVYSMEHDYMGTLDIEAYVDGRLCLVDLKSSNGLYNTVRLQTVAYLKADEEERRSRKDRVKYEGRWAIRLTKETEEEYAGRMARKNAMRELKGKGAYAPKPYQAFEVMNLDEEGDEMESDWQAFLAAKTLFEWNRKTETWKK